MNSFEFVAILNEFLCESREMLPHKQCVPWDKMEKITWSYVHQFDLKF